MASRGAKRRVPGWTRATVVLLSLALLLGASPSRASPEAADATRQHLYAGTLAAGIAELERRVAAAPADKEARFGLGMLHFARAVEHLGQASIVTDCSRRIPSRCRCCACRCR